MSAVIDANKLLLFILPFLQPSHRSDRDHSVQGFTVFDFASFCFDTDQVGEVLKVEEQQVIPKVQERQTLQGEEIDRESERDHCLDQTWVI